MHITQDICCPNCGSAARRHQLSGSFDSSMRCPGNQETQVECPTCDYLIVTCSLNGSVVEAYAPGLSGAPRPLPMPSVPVPSGSPRPVAQTFVPPRVEPLPPVLLPA